MAERIVEIISPSLPPFYSLSKPIAVKKFGESHP